MQSVRDLRLRSSPAVVCGMASLILAAFTSCGMPGAPLPPSLNLPVPVTDLSAVRSGGQVALSWSMPTKTTDKVLLKGNIAVRVCRSQSNATQCSIAATLSFAPGAAATYTDALPFALADGPAHVLTYSVELLNRKARSAGLSNRAQVLAGEAPAVVEGLSAEMRKGGVLLRWAPAPSTATPAAIRLVRHLLTAPTKKTDQGPLAESAEPLEQTLIVEPTPNSDRALDTSIRFGETYEYRAQRVARITIDGSTLELAGPLSSPLRVNATSAFPPSPPRRLEAVATAGKNGSGPAIDLSWFPGTEPDLAGYIVYRRDLGAAGSGWQRISAQPVIGPGFHDANVEPGLTYGYAVTAIDRDGHESARSTEALETVPAS